PGARSTISEGVITDMTSFLVRRFLFFIPTFFVISLITFVLMKAAPGGPWDRDAESKQVDARTVKLLEAQYGLNKPAWRQRSQKMSSYLMNGAVCGFGGISPGSYKSSQFDPNAIILWQGLETNPGDFNDGSSGPSEGITRLHTQGTTVGVVDGNTEYIKTRMFYAEGNITTKNRLWCNPATPNGR
ncbi:MAG: hypothetical protein ACKPGK_07005, partial [Verrucomicrobiota bacterium]